MWQWWVSRSSSAVVILASMNTLDHSLKLKLVVITTLVCSPRRAGSAHPRDQALQQIKDMGYADKYRARGEPIHLIGVAFSKASRNIVDV
jgi:hypothetical protein